MGQVVREGLKGAYLTRDLTEVRKQAMGLSGERAFQAGE